MRSVGAKNGYSFVVVVVVVVVVVCRFAIVFFCDQICCSFSFSGFKEYLASAPDYDFPSYRQLVHDITQKFNKISSDVITIETKLREAGYTSIAELIRKIQLKEKEKLELVSEQMKVEKKKFLASSYSKNILTVDLVCSSFYFFL